MSRISDLIDTSKLEVDVLADRVHQTNRERGRVHSVETWTRVRRLGAGGFAEVHLEQCVVQDEPQDHKFRAVKQLLRDNRIDYRRELEAVTLFSLPKYRGVFVEFFGWYDTIDHIFLVMEYLPLGDLSNYMNRAFPENEVQIISRQLIVALDFMHERNFVHRDLKPANVLVCNRGPRWWVKIADFGISKRAQAGDETLRTAVYTPGFEAPEVLIEDKYTRAVDIWSIGIIAFLLLTGDKYVFTKAELVKHFNGSLDSPMHRLHERHVSSHGCEVIMTLLSSKPEDRPSTASCLEHNWVVAEPTLSSELRRNSVDTTSALDNVSQSQEAYAEWTTINAEWKPSSSPSSKPPMHSPELGNTSISALRPMMHKLKQVASSPSLFKPTTQRGKTLASRLSQISFRESDAESAESQSLTTPSKPDNVQHAGHSAQSNVVSTTIFDAPRIKAHGEMIDPSTSSTSGRRPPLGTERSERSMSEPHDLTAPARGDSYNLNYHDNAHLETDGLKESQKLAMIGPSKDDQQTDLTKAKSEPISLDIDYGQDGFKILESRYGEVCAVAFSPEGGTLVTTHLVGTVVLWQTVDGQRLKRLKGHSRSANKVVFSPDGQMIGTTSLDTTVRLWNVSTGKEHKRIVAEHLAFSPNGLVVATASISGTVRFFEIATGEELSMRIRDERVGDLVFSPDGRILATVTYETVRLWDPATGRELRQLDGHARNISKLAFSPDGLILATSSREKTVRLWETATGRELRPLAKYHDYANSIEFSPDGSIVATSSWDDKTAHLWDVTTGRKLRQLKGHTGFISQSTFSPDGHIIATSSEDNTIRIWDTQTGKELKQLRGHTGGVTSVVFSPDGRVVATASADRTVRLWDWKHIPTKRSAMQKFRDIF